MKENNPKYQNKIQDERIRWLEDRFAKMNEELGEIKTNVATLCVNIKWLIDDLKTRKKYKIGRDIAIIGAVVSALLVVLFK